MRFLLLCLLGLAGCASVPDTTLHYYPAKAKTTITVTHAISCSSDLKHYAVASKAETATATMADLEAPLPLNTNDFKNHFGNTGLTINFKDDGRLSSFNAEGTGAGGEIVKTVIGLATGKLATVSAEAVAEKPPSASAICKLINKLGEKNTLIYTERAMFESPSALASGNGGNLKFAPDQVSTATMRQFGKLGAFLPVSSVHFEKSKLLKQVARPANQSGSTRYPTIKLRPVQQVEFMVTVSAFMVTEPLPVASMVLPGSGMVDVPIAKPGFFGSNETEITLSDVGAITKIHYGARDAVAASFSAVNTIVQSTAARTPAQEAADLNSQADIIAAATRLANCRAHPDTCKAGD